MKLLRSFFLHEHGSGSSALVFHEPSSGAPFFQYMAPAPVSVRFYTLTINYLGVPQVEWKMKYIKYTKCSKAVCLKKQYGFQQEIHL